MWKFAVASGRRNAWNFVRLPPAPSGSSTAMISYSAPAGTLPPRRNNPFRNMLYALNRASGVETSAVGLSASRRLKIGSVPCDARNLRSTSLGRMLHPDWTRWQDAHDRPFDPCGIWNSLSKSTKPAVLNVAAVPDGLGTGRLFVSRPPLNDSGEPGSASSRCAAARVAASARSGASVWEQPTQAAAATSNRRRALRDA